MAISVHAPSTRALATQHVSCVFAPPPCIAPADLGGVRQHCAEPAEPQNPEGLWGAGGCECGLLPLQCLYKGARVGLGMGRTPSQLACCAAGRLGMLLGGRFTIDCPLG